MIREPTARWYPSARRVPKLVSGTGHALLGAVWKNNPFTRAYLDDERTDVERAAGWLSGSCLLLVARHSDAVGGSTRATSMYMEDVDPAIGSARPGGRTCSCPAQRSAHQGDMQPARTRVDAAGTPRQCVPFPGRPQPGALRAPLRWGLRVGLALVIPDRRACSAPELDQVRRRPNGEPGGES